METHSALLEQWYFLVKEMPKIDFHFYVSTKVKDKLKAIPEEKITVIPSIYKDFFERYNLLIVNTLHRNFTDYIAVFKEKKVLCLVHNFNFSLLFKSILLQNIFIEKSNFLYFAKLYVLENVFFKRKVIKQATKFGFLSNSVLQYAQKSITKNTNFELLQMSFVNNFTFSDFPEIQIIMPGNVSNKRKDVDLIFKIISKLNPISKLHFTFLGKPENDVILKKIENLKQNCNKNIQITHFNEFIAFNDYQKIIEKAHVVLCPIKEKTSFYWVSEIYGKTKVSGAENDCIYNGKIGIFPSIYSKMDWYNYSYANETELVHLLTNLTLENIKLDYTKLEPFLKKYTFENVKNKLESQLLSIINE